MSLFRIINLSQSIYKEIRIQKKFNAQFLIPYLSDLEIKHVGQFSQEQRTKIIDYYGMFITSFLCSSYKKLYGGKLNEAERKRATLFGILTPVGDDLFDIDKLDHESIKKITFEPDQYIANTFSAKVTKEVQSFLLNDVPHLSAYKAAAQAVLDIQIETVQQTNSQISEETLERITYKKGAVSVIIYYQILEQTADEKMLLALEEIGGLFQLGNDIFDLYKDVRDGIYTLVNTCPDYTVFKEHFIKKVAAQNREIMNLPCAQNAKKDFCFVMNIINARSMVAIDQLIQKQMQHGKNIQWNQLDRKDMICDMEKPMNIIRWLNYMWKMPKY
jgi:hypothetical protein